MLPPLPTETVQKTSNKDIQDFLNLLDDGRIISNYVIKKALEIIILVEDKHSPLSDDELGEHLNKAGYKMARRTIAKYRDQLGYPVARLRKEF